MNSITILGHGVAGATLAWKAIERGLVPKVYDPSQSQAASRVAGGLVSPISGQKLTYAWRGMDFYRESERFFRAREHDSGLKLWFPFPSLWAFDELETAQIFKRKFVESNSPIDPGLKLRELNAIELETEFPRAVARENGGAIFEPGAFVELTRFLDWSENELRRLGLWLDTLPDKNSLTVRCLGKWELPQTPQLPWGQTKGECVDFFSSELPRDQIQKRRLALIPIEGDRFRASATFENRPADPLPSERGAGELARLLARQLQLARPLKTFDHRAGIRTYASDHSAVVGKDPSSNDWILNGLGSKGILWSSLCSDWLLQAITQNEETLIPERFRASRFHRAPNEEHSKQRLKRL